MPKEISLWWLVLLVLAVVIPTAIARYIFGGWAAIVVAFVAVAVVLWRVASWG